MMRPREAPCVAVAAVALAVCLVAGAVFLVRHVFFAPDDHHGVLPHGDGDLPR